MPTAKDRERHVHCILLRMMLDLRRLVMARHRPSEETLVHLAIRLGEYEGRPVNAAEIAALVRIPRTSVLRHLSALEARGRVRTGKVGRRVVRRLPKEESPETIMFFRDAERIIRRACFELSKMDTLPARRDQ